MKVTVNGKTVEIFAGATVADALRAWSAEALPAVQRGERTVTDKRGRRVMLDGALAEGQALFVTAVDK
jgi:sulfur carrier protein ThiS